MNSRAIQDMLVQLTLRHADVKALAVATHDGLVLAATEGLAGDIPAACAASLAVHTDDALSVIEPAPAAEMLIWTSRGPWYLVRLRHGHLLLARGETAESAGALRFVGQIVAEQLNPILTPME